MFQLEKVMSMQPYELQQEEKEALYQDVFRELNLHHYENCGEYRRILDVLQGGSCDVEKMEDIPFLPVRLFKDFELCSTDRNDVVKTMTSSGTTGQQVSKIFLDKYNSANQTKALARICGDFLGNKRLPMLVIDSKKVIRDRNLFSARGAGILGFSMLGRDVTYALDDEMKLDLEGVNQFLKRHEGEDILLFGFTFMIWEHFYRTLHSEGIRLPLDRAIAVHGGGWKKLLDQAVDNEAFKARLKEVCGAKQVLNYYGMVEQTGSIFMECECGRLHASVFSDLLVRKPEDFSVCGVGETGLIQLLSVLPTSYPGHSILTEDLGELIGVDDCPCGRRGKTFRVHGRVKNAEVRGCSDTYEVR